MHSERFAIRYVTVQDCFVRLPNAWLRRLTSKSNVVKLTHNDRDLYFTWQSRPVPDDTLGISATLARVLGIEEGDDVFVTTNEDPPTVSSVVVVPRNSQDWEIVELQSRRIQESLLDQLSVVAANQEIVIWISRSLSVVLKIESIEPKVKVGRLRALTEISVAPPVSSKEPGSTSRDEQVQNASWGIFGKYFTKTETSVDDESKKNANRYEELIKKTRVNLPETYRVLPLRKPHPSSESSELGPFDVFVKRHFLPEHLLSDSQKQIYCKVSKISENTKYVKTTSTNFLREEQRSTNELIVRVLVAEDFERKINPETRGSCFEHDSLHASVFVSESVRRNLKLKIGSKVTLERVEAPSGTVESLEIVPWSRDIDVDLFKGYVDRLTRSEKMLVNSGAKMYLGDDGVWVLNAQPALVSHFLIDGTELGQIRIKNLEARQVAENETDDIDESREPDTDLVVEKAFRHALDECESSLSLSLGLDRRVRFEYDRENILICGKSGGGKTTLCLRLRNIFERAPNYVHVGWIDCKSLKGKKVETLHKALLQVLVECVYHQPSILILDDLECVAGRVLNDEENTPDAINVARTADMVINVITEYQKVHYVSVVATCSHPSKVNNKLVAPRGVHVFRSIIALPDLEKEVRIEVLRSALSEKAELSEDIDWNRYGNKSEGWQARDLRNFAEKGAFAAWKRHVQRGDEIELTINEEDLNSSLERSMPTALQGIGLYSGPGHAWSDIGGLASVKRSLIELLNWPLKYPELFKNAPIQRQGGVLLYGAPGTGKTMLAGAIAKECGLNFISVKGPELLSKYIGASEESVRNVFDKANSAKPCVLFFDEFDSLAPRRGHDSTGVTDRVVNQFLAQLDGVEGREGVAVVAASSRPDLLDPALLRPGRLDKALLCPLPNREEREEILRAVCRSREVDDECLDLEGVALRTDGFTGADLNAIVSQARLAVLGESSASTRGESGELEMGKVTQKHLIDALGTTRASITSLEKLKYDRIYSKFSKGDDFSEDLTKNQRATLA